MSRRHSDSAPCRLPRCSSTGTRTADPPARPGHQPDPGGDPWPLSGCSPAGGLGRARRIRTPSADLRSWKRSCIRARLTPTWRSCADRWAMPGRICCSRRQLRPAAVRYLPLDQGCRRESGRSPVMKALPAHQDRQQGGRTDPQERLDRRDRDLAGRRRRRAQPGQHQYHPGQHHPQGRRLARAAAARGCGTAPMSRS